MVGVFVAISAGAPQADINPAVTLAKTVMKTYTISQMVSTMLAQLIGAFLGAVVVWITYLGHWRETDDAGLKLGVFSTAPAIRNRTTNMITEIIGTIVLVMGVGAIFSGATAPNGPSVGLGPYLVGALVWGIGLSLGGPTGYAINPARDLGPRIAHQLLPIAGKGSSDWEYGWIPVVAPIAGAIVGAFLFKVLFA